MKFTIPFNSVPTVFTLLRLQMSKKLAAFDFDHTIVDANSDVIAINLINQSLIPESTKRLHRSDGWTVFMQGIFELLHANDINQSVITESIKRIPAVDGFCNLIRELKDNLNYDIIIISDSNMYFINTWLKENQLDSYILKVFTNPAKFVDDLLKIEMYHYQDYCKLSTKNLCKGQILEDFIKDSDVIYDKIVYVGDGSNDFCPILRLNENDLACVRDQYKCVDLIRTAQAGNSYDSNGKKQVVKANVCIWKNGLDILNFIKK